MDLGARAGIEPAYRYVLPEVLKAMFKFAPGSAEFEHTSELLDEIINHVNIFPAPGG